MKGERNNLVSYVYSWILDYIGVGRLFLFWSLLLDVCFETGVVCLVCYSVMRLLYPCLD